MPFDPPTASIEAAVALALAEDRAWDDVTTLATVAADLRGRAVLVAKEAGIVAGLPVAAETFRQVDELTTFQAPR